jgi:hypothetical protein
VDATVIGAVSGVLGSESYLGLYDPNYPPAYSSSSYIDGDVTCLNGGVWTGTAIYHGNPAYLVVKLTCTTAPVVMTSTSHISVMAMSVTIGGGGPSPSGGIVVVSI